MRSSRGLRRVGQAGSVKVGRTSADDRRMRLRRLRTQLPTPAARAAAVLVGLGSAALLASVPDAAAEIYRWTDEDGRVHFTQDLSQVPKRERSAAEARAQAPSGPSRIQTYTPPASAARSYTKSKSAAKPTVGQRYVIPVQRAGTSLMVNVRLNDSVDAVFLMDTGATDVIIPVKVARELGLEVGPGEGRTKIYSTANGIVSQQTVSLDSVSLGGARVQNVVASISSSMDIGLLGLSYFNHFNYSIDSARGVVTLTPNKLADEGLIRGGRSEAQWRSEYGSLKARIEQVERTQEEVPRSRSRRHAALQEQLAELERQWKVLESEADQAHVPFRWRD